MGRQRLALDIGAAFPLDWSTVEEGHLRLGGMTAAGAQLATVARPTFDPSVSMVVQAGGLVAPGRPQEPHAYELSVDMWVSAGETLTIGSADQPPTQLANGIYGYGFYLTGATLHNAGTIDIVSPGGMSGVAVWNGSAGTGFHNAASGVFNVVSYDASVNGHAHGYFHMSTGSSQFFNEGLVRVWGALDAWGVELYGGKFANTGTIKVYGDRQAYGLETHGSDVQNNGVLEVVGRYAAYGAWVTSSFDNTGYISARTTTDGYASVGLFIEVIDSTSLDFHNSGVIEADYAIRSSRGDYGETPTPSRENIYNTGTLRGALDLAHGDDSVTNTGFIEGLILFGDGNDRYLGQAGVLLGEVDGGEGADILLGGASHEGLFGGIGGDTINGGSGDDYIDGGFGDDDLDGGVGVDTLFLRDATAAMTVDLAAGTMRGEGNDHIHGFEVVVGSRFNDMLKGGDGAEQLRGQAGDDTITGGGGADTLQGGRGVDKLTGGAGDDRYVFQSGDGADVVMDFVAGGTEDRLVIRGYAAYQSLVQQGADTRVVLSATDSILLKNVQAASLTAADFEFAAAVEVEDHARSLQTQVLHHDLVISADQTLTFVDPDSVSVQTLWYDSTAFVLEQNFHSPDVSLFNSGLIELSAASVWASIKGVASAAGGLGRSVMVNQAGGVLDVASLNAADAVGVWGMQLWNHGVMRVSSAGGDATGVHSEDFNGRFSNAGEMEIEAGGLAIGVSQGNAGLIHNASLVSVTGGAGGVGLRVTGSNPIVVNSGTIEVTDLSGAGEAVGILYGSGSSVVIHNTGLISAEVALRWVFSSTGDMNALYTVYNSGVLDGAVQGGRGREQLFNAGTIVGRVELGDGADLYDGRLGSQTGGAYGRDGDDILRGGLGADLLDGGAGADILSGGAGADRLVGGGGNDVFRFEAGSGEDTIWDFVAGGTDDRVEVVGYGAYLSIQQIDADVLVRFSATDTLLLKNVSLAQITASDFLFNQAAIAGPSPLPSPPVAPATPLPIGTNSSPTAVQSGGQGDDTLVGGSGVDLVLGFSGADNLQGGAGDDRMEGGEGADVIRGGAGVDYLVGGTGADTFLWASGDGRDVFADFNANEGDVLRVTGSPNWDGQGMYYDFVELYLPTGEVLTFEHYPGAADGWFFYDFIGGSAADVIEATIHGWIEGRGGADTLTGSAYVDCLDGGDGNDILDGREGGDSLFGGAGNDILYGSFLDRLDGGTGHDLFRYQGGVVTVTGFSAGGSEDRIEVAAFAAFTSYTLRQQGADLLVVFQWTDWSKQYLLLKDVSVAAFTAADIDIGRTGTVLFVGSDAADNLVGTAEADTLEGALGADLLTGGAGADIIIGGRGDDALTGGAGDDLYRFAAGDGKDVVSDFAAGGAEDRIEVTGFATYELVQAGADLRVIFDSENEILLKGVSLAAFSSADINIAPRYVINGTSAAETLSGGAGVDIISGGDGADVLNGGDGADVLDGGRDADSLTGGAGDDLFRYGPDGGADTIIGFTAGGAEDRIEVTGFASYTLQQVGADLRIVFDQANSILLKNVLATDFTSADINIKPGNTGTAGDDSWTGTGSADRFLGGGGDDVLVGNAGDDVLEGGDGDDRLAGGLGNDTLIGGAGFDVADFSASTVSVDVYLTSGIAYSFPTATQERDTLAGVEGIIGTAFSETVWGSVQNNYLDGGGGDDELYGELGDDLLVGGAGRDWLSGGAGFDTVSYAGAAGPIFLSSTYPEQNAGDAAGDQFFEIEQFVLSAHDDTASMTTVVLRGGAGDDRLSGARYLYGDEGDDILYAQAGRVVLEGGVGRDTFVIGGYSNSVITDFDASEDVLVLQADQWAPGLNYWAEQVGADMVLHFSPDHGVTLQNVSAAAFLTASVSGAAAFEGVHAGAESDDTYVGTAGANYATGEGGDDSLWGGAARDVFYGGDGHDLLVGAGAGDSLNGGAGDDLLVGGGGGDQLDGGQGLDFVSYADASEGVGATMMSDGAYISSFGDGQGDNIWSVEGLIGSNFDDVLEGASFAENQVLANDVLFGGGGADLLYGRMGLDQLYGGSGDDILVGGWDADYLDGGEGVDTVWYDRADGVTLDLATHLNWGRDAAGDLFVSIERFRLSRYADTFIGSAGDDWAAGEGSADDLRGGGGADTLMGDDGNDRLDGGAGDDVLTGGLGDDRYVFTGGHDVIEDFVAGGSDDWIEVFGFTSFTKLQEGADLRIMFDANNTILLKNVSAADFMRSDISIGEAPAPNVVEGTDGGETLTGGGYVDILNGLGGNDSLIGNAGDDVLNGGDGNDRLVGGAGNDALNGGNGTDQADYRNATAAVTVNLLAGTATGEGSDTLSSVENVQGSAFADSLTGDAGANNLNGHAGADTLNGGDGADTLIGGAGADALNGGLGLDYASYISATAGVSVNLLTNVHTGDAAGDTFTGIERFRLSAFADSFQGGAGTNYAYGAEGNDALRGGAGFDRLYGEADNDQLFGEADNDVLIGGAGADAIDGGAGKDGASYETAAAAVSLNLTSGVHTGDAVGDTFTAIEFFILGRFDDSFTGGAAADEAQGGAGADTLSGAGGADWLRGQDGNDILNGEIGDDILEGGAGADQLNGGDGVDYASYLKAVGINRATGVHAGEALGDTFNSVERFRLSGYDDSFVGSAGDDWVAAYMGNDSLSGGDGNDTLNGGGSSDTLVGGAGNDKLIGEAGNDTLTGGAGSDAFQFTAGLFGADVITDFGAGDYIRVTGIAGVDAFNDLVVTQAGANTLITFPDGSTITLNGVSAATIDANDFSFG